MKWQEIIAHKVLQIRISAQPCEGISCIIKTESHWHSICHLNQNFVCILLSIRLQQVIKWLNHITNQNAHNSHIWIFQKHFYYTAHEYEYFRPEILVSCIRFECFIIETMTETLTHTYKFTFTILSKFVQNTGIRWIIKHNTHWLVG